jgi:glycosyltransferase 2 family protein
VRNRLRRVREAALALGRNRWTRVFVAVAVLGGVAAALWLGPDWNSVGDAFRNVQWEWVAVAIAINLASIVSRAIAWDLVIDQAMTKPPGFPHVFSAFSVGMLANAALPGRIGELARVGVLTRHTSRRRGVWATLAGTVVAHRIFDLFPIVLLVLYVLVTAKIPAWAYSIIVAVVCIGATLFVLAVLSARSAGHTRLDGVGAVRRAMHMAREGLAVMHRPLAAVGAIFFQTLGWLCQLFAVFTAMRAFDIHEGVPAAALVLLVMNVATVVPLWPGNVGAVQVAIAVPLVSYGVAYADGIAFGFGLQAIEASVGIGLGLIFLAREGLSFATLRRMPAATDRDFGTEEPEEPPAPEAARARARVPG